MSLNTGRAKLVGSLKDLLLRWEKAKMSWDDAMSADLELTVLAPLDPKIRAAAMAMEKMGEMVSKARRDCE